MSNVNHTFKVSVIQGRRVSFAVGKHIDFGFLETFFRQGETFVGLKRNGDKGLIFVHTNGRGMVVDLLEVSGNRIDNGWWRLICRSRVQNECCLVFGSNW